jgi:hypothetical protein
MKIADNVRDFLATIGTKGGKSRSKAKVQAARNNGKVAGGRPRTYPKCPRYSAHRFTQNRCPCGYVRAS